MMPGRSGEIGERPQSVVALRDKMPRALIWRRLVETLALAFAVFHLYTATFGTLEGMQQRVVHLGFALVLIFLTRPLGRRPEDGPRLVDLSFVLAALISTGYLAYEGRGLAMRLGIAYERDIVLGAVLVVVLLEATRRVAGLALPLLCALSVIYAYFGPYMPRAMAHGGFDFEDITVNLYLTTEGIFSIPLAVSSSYIVLFIILGAILQASGAAQFFSDLAYGLFGRVRGGPAKVAIMGSGMFGMISGSAVANVSSTGVLTIPLMRRSGFDARFAGAVEAVASSCGQFTPPIMAAAGFVIAETLGVPYLEVAAAALVPAILFYASLFVAVDLRAGHAGIKGESKENLPQIGKTFRAGGYLLLVPITLVVMLAVFGYSPLRAAIYTIGVNILLFLGRELLVDPRARAPAVIPLLLAIHGATILIDYGVGSFWAAVAYGAMLLGMGYLARDPTRLSAQFLWRFICKVAAALRSGALGSLEVAAACASAGIIVGMLMLTGLGLRLSGMLVDLAGGSLPVLLVLTMIASLILGMGMPTLGAYIVLAVLVAPSLVNMGVEPLAAHLFIFYFGVISTITPPVCMAAFAAAAISGADPMRTGVTAFRLGIAVFIVPFIMIYHPPLILQGSIVEIAIVSTTALAGAAAIAASLEGYLLRPMSLVERGLVLLGGISLISGGFVTDLAGGGILTASVGIQLLRVAQSRQKEDIVK